MLAHYLERDRQLKVPYYDKQTQANASIVVENGHFVDPITRKPITTKGSQMMVTTFPEGTLITVERPRTLIFHHSSLPGGADVSMAGYVRINDGKLEFASNTSGHYQPPLSALAEILKFWRSKGVSLDQTRIGFQVAITSSKAETFFYEMPAIEFLRFMEKQPGSPQELLAQILELSPSATARANAVAHLLLLNKEISAAHLELLRNEVRVQNPDVIEELLSLVDSDDFNGIIKALEPIQNLSTEMLQRRYHEAQIEGRGSD